MGKDSKPKTDNELHERFQWTKELDPDHIFEEEKEMIKELREKIPQLEKESDKFVATFLFARRHDVKEAASLLTKFYKLKAQYAPAFDNHHIPSFKYTKLLRENRDMLGLPLMQPRGYRDNHGRMLRMMVLVLDNPSLRNLEFTYTLSYWQIYYQIASEPLNAWRNGTVVVLDLKDCAFRNVDLSSKGREVSKAMQGVFPTRIRSMLCVNGGTVMGALLTAGKFVLPKKMMKRVENIDTEKLKELIPPEYLIPHFGGSSPNYFIPDFLAEIAEVEDELFEKGIWKVPEGATTIAIAGADTAALEK